MRFRNKVILLILFPLLMHTPNASDVVAKYSGDFVQGGLVIGQVTPGSKIKIDTYDVRVTEKGEFILGFGRDYPETATITITQADGSSTKRVLKIAQRNYKIQRINGLPHEQVHPSEKTLVRIKKERESITIARSLDDDRLDFKKGFIWPAQGPITGVYGSQRILNGEPRQPHYGIDIAAPVGTNVVAPASGLVTYAQDMYFSGYTLVLDHGHNLSSSFLHLDKIFVQEGDYVQQGEKIALVGATGRVTGPHLDWRMNWRDQRLDPGLLMDDLSKNQ